MGCGVGATIGMIAGAAGLELLTQKPLIPQVMPQLLSGAEEQRVRQRVVETIMQVLPISREREGQAAGEERRQDYFVRIQVQGTKLQRELYLPLAKETPITKQEVHLALTALAYQLSKEDEKDLRPAFGAASQWATTAANAGGAPVGNYSFYSPGVPGREKRVDIEVKRGQPNVVHGGVGQ